MDTFRTWKLIASVIFAASIIAVPGHAQVPPNVLVAGQVQGAFGGGSGGWCYVRQGASEFQINGTNSIAVISFPKLLYWDGSYHPLDGQSRLSFTSATGGTIKFKLWGASAEGSFSGFAETNTGQQYIVTFTITFPNGCSLPISAGYETP